MPSQETVQSLKVKIWPIDRFVPYPRNPGKNSAAVDRMCASMREFGFKIPIFARSDGEVVDGHPRLKAARKLNITEIPVILCDEWTPTQVKASRLIVNRSVTWADWDEEALALGLQDLQEADFDLSLTGFEDLKSGRLHDAQDATDGLTDEDAVPELPEAPVSRTGRSLASRRSQASDWRCDQRERCESANGSDVADLIFTDPPYNVSYEGYTEDRLMIRADRMSDSEFKLFLTGAFCSCRIAVKPGVSLYVCHSSSVAPRVQNALESAGFEVRYQIIWAKNTFAWGFGRYKFQHEPMFYAHVAGEKDP